MSTLNRFFESLKIQEIEEMDPTLPLYRKAKGAGNFLLEFP